jgi:pimeloyl-ACP methyl ester carboxylesterase
VPVLLVPGFAATDIALEPMAEALRRRGHWTSRSGIGPNVGCTQDMADGLERRLEVVAERVGQRVAIVGWSRGGTLGKLVAVRRPDLVERSSPSVRRTARRERPRRADRGACRCTRRYPKPARPDCLSGDCARSAWC